MAHSRSKLVCTSWSCQQAAGGQHPYARSYSDTQEGWCSFNAAAQCICIQWHCIRTEIHSKGQLSVTKNEHICSRLYSSCLAGGVDNTFSSLPAPKAQSDLEMLMLAIFKADGQILYIPLWFAVESMFQMKCVTVHQAIFHSPNCHTVQVLTTRYRIQQRHIRIQPAQQREDKYVGTVSLCTSCCSCLWWYNRTPCNEGQEHW